MNRCSTAGALLLLAAGLVVGDAPARRPEADKLIDTIRKIGREGAGNPEAAKAWKSLVALGPAALQPILRGMNDDDLVASNWLRPAFEAAAEKAVQDKTLSAADLEKAVNDRTLAGSARRLAYEWLTKLDRSAPDRLMPAMLLDPSAELRREAVERVVKSAQQALEKKDEKAAREQFQRAFAGAADPDQIETTAKALEKLGVKVDLQKKFGAVTTWHLIAPFEHHKNAGWNVAYPPEKGIDLSASYKGKDGKEVKWVPHVTTHAQGLVDLNKALDKHKGAVAYAVAFIDSPEGKAVELRAGCINGLKIFLNGKEIFAREEYHHGMRIDQYAARGTLKKGRNVILVKVCQNEQKDSWAQSWQFQLRVTDFVGSGVAFTAAKSEGEGK